MRWEGGRPFRTGDWRKALISPLPSAHDTAEMVNSGDQPDDHSRPKSPADTQSNWVSGQWKNETHDDANHNIAGQPVNHESCKREDVIQQSHDPDPTPVSLACPD